MQDKFCRKCGTLIVENSKFCKKCGNPTNSHLRDNQIPNKTSTPINITPSVVTSAPTTSPQEIICPTKKNLSNIQNIIIITTLFLLGFMGAGIYTYKNYSQIIPFLNNQSQKNAKELYSITLVEKDDNVLGGFIDKSGNVVIKPQFSKWCDFSEGLAAVCVNEKWGYINKTGNYVIEPQYDIAEPFSDGIAQVGIQTGLNCKVGYINKKGKYIINPQYEYTPTKTCNPFNEGLAAVSVNNKWTYINKKGFSAFKNQFDNARNFSEGMAAVCVNEKWGYINASGTYVIKLQFENAVDFSEGLAPIRKNNKWGYINKFGKIVIKPQFNNVQGFSEGMAVVRIGSKCGVINKKGELTINPQYEFITPFNGDLAGIVDDDKCGFINQSGEIVIPPSFEWADKFDGFDGELAYICVNKTNNEYAYINRKGTIIWETPKNPITKKYDQVKSEMQSIATALESYYVDNNQYPPPDYDNYNNPVLPKLLTTPIAYLINYFKDPFSRENKQCYGYMNANTRWVILSLGPDGVSGNSNEPDGNIFDLNPSVSNNLSYSEINNLTYDPTNGLNSGGDIWRRGP